MSLLRGDGVALVRGGRLLFEGLDLALAPGEALHITGPNGSGKSSLIRLVAGLLRPSAGRIERAEAALANEGLALDRLLPLGRALAFWNGPRLAEAMTGAVPIRVETTRDGRWVITSNAGDGTLTFIDARTRKVARQLPVSGSREAAQVTILLSRDGKRLYAAETGRDQVAEVDLASGKVLRRLPAGKNGDGLAIAP